MVDRQSDDELLRAFCAAIEDKDVREALTIHSELTKRGVKYTL